MDEDRVSYFLMGKNEWRTCNQFPPEKSELTSFFLQSEKGANSSSGNGKLSITSFGTGFDTFIYDPENPVPTKGGVNSHMMPELAGIKDQSEVEKRDDILVYTTDELKKDMEIVGEVKVKLYVSSDAIDTDFTAKLIELRPNGYARIIEDGIAKTRFRNGFDKKELMTPGEIYELEILIGSTAISIPKGHKLRLEISSSNFPKFPRNHNTGVRETDAVTFQKANQRIYHSKKYPSQLLLPIIKKI